MLTRFFPCYCPLRLEVADTLDMAERCARTDAASVTRALALLQKLPISVVPGSLDVFDAVARDHKLTVATLDRGPIVAAQAVGVAVVTA